MNKIAIIFLSIIVSVQLHAMNFNVTNTADSGAGSLRQAILDSNANGPGTNTITFTGAGVGTISIFTVLPIITIPVTINVTGEAITVEDAGFGNVLIGFQIDVGGFGSTLQDLTIQNFGPNNTVGTNGTGVFLNGASNVTIDTCIIQNNVGGSSAANATDGGEGYGIRIDTGDNNIVQNCTITGNNGGNSNPPSTPAGNGGAGRGILISDGDSNVIQMNSITNNTGGDGGTPSAGGAGAGGIGGIGVGVDIIGTSVNNIVQNNTMISDNIAGNGGNGDSGLSANGGAGGNGHGVRITASGSNSVLNNILIDGNNGGNGGDGNNGGNGGTGGSSYGVLTLGANTVSGNNTITNHIGGNGGDGGNNISGGGNGGNAGNGYGIRVEGGNNLIQDNGVISGNTGGVGGLGGNANPPNAGDGGLGGNGAGISVNSGTQDINGNGSIENNVGGDGGAGGTVGGDGGDGGNATGIELLNVNADFVRNNTIGLNGPAGIGGVPIGSPGIISGVLIDTGDENPILNNMITGNSSAFGIRLINGGNNDQVEPTLTNVQFCQPTNEVTVMGSLTGTSLSTTFTIQLFTNGVNSDPEQGRIFMGDFSVVTNGAGNVTFNETFPVVAGVANDFATATATRMNGATSTDTSEFSVPRQIVANQAPTALPQNLFTDINTPVSGTLMAIDPELQSLTFAITSGPSNGMITSFNVNTGAFTYTPNMGFLGNDSFMFTVSDGCSVSAAATVTINVLVIQNALILGDGINPNNNVFLEVFPAAVLQAVSSILQVNDA